MAGLAHPWGLLPLAAALLTWATAFFVLGHAKGRAVNRLLFTLLLLEGFAVAVNGVRTFAAPDALAARATFNSALFHAATDVPIACLYLLFLGAALRTPLTAPLATRMARVVLPVVAVAGAALPFLLPGLYLSDLRPLATPSLLFDHEATPEPLYPAGWLVLLATFLYGLVAAVHAWRRAPAGLERDRARAFVLAFGARDLLFTGALLAAMWSAFAGTSAQTFAVVVLVYSAPMLLYIPLLAYAILKAQLFDIDVRVKAGIRGGTLAAAFVAVFFVVSELAANFLTQQWGAVTGVVAAGLLVFALTPLQRMAERVSEAAMPGVANTPEYLRYRKFEVYKAALETASRDGVLTERERATLDVLRRELGIAPQDAAAMERGLTRA